LTIEYGPLEMVLRRNSALSGTWSRYSSGAADADGSAMMLRKSLVGRASVSSIVRSSGVVIPGMSLVSR
jgi:hypothetical protein